MSFLKDMKIKNKIRIPVIMQLILVVVFLYFFWEVQSQLSEGQVTRKIVGDINKKIRVLSFSVSDYLSGRGTKTYDNLQAEYQVILKQVAEHEERLDAGGIEAFRKLGGYFEKVENIFKDNESIRKEVTTLTDFSIQQSNEYLKQISRKLVDKTKRTAVSDLEKSVIEGASLNTTANYDIKVLFLQVEDNPSLSGNLMTLLDKILQNADADMIHLANTPFAELPKKAKEANLKIKEISTRFLANLKNLDGLKQESQILSDKALQAVIEQDFSNTEFLHGLIKSVFFKLIAILLVTTLVIVVLGVTLIRSIMAPLKAMMERAHELAVEDVDMTRRLDVISKDEFGELSGWFNKFLERLHDLVLKVKGNSQQLYVNTEAIRDGSDHLSTRTNEQAASITETSATLEQFAAAIRDNTESSAEADMMLQDFNAEIQEKISLINNVTDTMTEIFDSSQQIDNIIRVINDISFQTNLLALNAAVEAARAGEAGRGFAVVAAEVRNLAQKTAESSKSIREIVLRNVESTQKGMKLVEATSRFFSDIVTMMGDIVTKITTITNVSREQATGIEQISQTISQMEHVITQNAEMVKKLASAGRNVEDSAEALKALTAQFRLDEALATKKTRTSEKPEKPKDGKVPHKPDLRSDKKTPIKKTIEKKETAEKRKETPVVKNSVARDTSKENKNKPQSTEDDFFAADEDGFQEF